MLLPVIGLVRLGEQARADRYTSLPLIGVFILITWIAASISGEKRGLWRAVLPSCAVLVVISLGVTAQRQVTHWHDSRRLFEHAVRILNDNYVAWQCLGITELERDDADAALRDFSRA